MPKRSNSAMLASVLVLAAASGAVADEFSTWVPLTSSFPSTGGGGITIKGYDPVIAGGKCLTTFMAVEAGDNPNVYPNFAEFDARSAAGGTLCTNGRWRAFDGGASGTTPFRMLFRGGRFLMPPS